MMALTRDMLFGSYGMLQAIELSVPKSDFASLIGNAPVSQPSTLFGIEVHPSPHFPMTVACRECHGSGEGGEEATYCGKCEGRGGFRYDGMMRNGRQTIMIKAGEAVPKKFAPYFPRDLPLPRRAASRSRDIPWPTILR